MIQFPAIDAECIDTCRLQSVLIHTAAMTLYSSIKAQRNFSMNADVISVASQASLKL